MLWQNRIKYFRKEKDLMSKLLLYYYQLLTNNICFSLLDVSCSTGYFYMVIIPNMCQIDLDNFGESGKWH